jgi:hypothetical protein
MLFFVLPLELIFEEKWVFIRNSTTSFDKKHFISDLA